MAKQINWISEPEAAEKLWLKPRTLRKSVKAGKLPIAFSTITGRKYHYSLTDIIKLQEKYSTSNYLTS